MKKISNSKYPRISFQSLKEPYRTHSEDSLKDFVRRYLADSEKEVTIDHRQYFKIIALSRFEVEGHDFSILVHVHQDMKVRINSILTDESDNHYIVKHIMLVRYASDQYPECIQVMPLLLKGNIEAIGDYLAVCEDG